jgi:hypothetical protein
MNKHWFWLSGSEQYFNCFPEDFTRGKITPLWGIKSPKAVEILFTAAQPKPMFVHNINCNVGVPFAKLLVVNDQPCFLVIIMAPPR